VRWAFGPQEVLERAYIVDVDRIHRVHGHAELAGEEAETERVVRGEVASRAAVVEIES